jgi:signal transduction histidine kinase
MRSEAGEQWSTDEVLERLSEGVLILDGGLQPKFANSAARSLLGLRGTTLPARLPSEEVRSLAARASADRARIDDVVRIWFPAHSTLRVRVEPLEGGEDLLAILQDVTEEVNTQRIRREFVAHASHELKSPVAGLQALAEAVRRAVDDDPAAAGRLAERLSFEAHRLGRLVADLLDLSKLEDPTARSGETVDLSSAARAVAAEVDGEAREKKLVLHAEIDPSVVVKGDEAQLRVLIRNLLDNAIRYTDGGGHVTIEVTREGPDAVVCVADDGIGIPLEAQSRVFERFYRVDRARARDRGGTGLGLAIVKHVAESHGGKVELHSELGRGSTFTARLPAVDAELEIRSVAG